jgi:hypothetical protein
MQRIHRTRWSAATSLYAAGALVAGLFAGPTQGQTPEELRPNLKPFPATDIRIASGTNDLRITATTWNAGRGPLELRGGELIGNDRQVVYQRIYRSDNSFYEQRAGEFLYHADHDHIHFEGYALYTLQPVNSPGASDRQSQKTTFCVMDNIRINLTLPGAPNDAIYFSCNFGTQGMSVGWGVSTTTPSSANRSTAPVCPTATIA